MGTILAIISTHAPAGGATEATTDAISTVYAISTHAPAGGATIRNAGLIRDGDLFLLTPLREGRHEELVPQEGIKKISTHAPAGGATITGSARADYLKISTHAPAGGATRAQSPDGWHEFISTHAPAGGATVRTEVAKMEVIAFLLTPLREGRQSLQSIRPKG